jgi:hypothetical protein
MSAPLSANQMAASRPLATGIYGSDRDLIAPRGSYIPIDNSLMNVYQGNAGNQWSGMPAFIAGTSNYAGLSTVTGVPEGTPDVGYTDKVGGGRTTAQIPDFGGTAAY